MPENRLRARVEAELLMNPNWQIVDHWHAFPLGSPATKLTAGMTEKAFGYETVRDSESLPQRERMMHPSFVSRTFEAELP